MNRLVSFICTGDSLYMVILEFNKACLEKSNIKK